LAQTLFLLTDVAGCAFVLAG